MEKDVKNKIVVKSQSLSFLLSPLHSLSFCKFVFNVFHHGYGREHLQTVNSAPRKSSPHDS
jgi:hypothetical protein